jgi:hypothetical protein
MPPSVTARAWRSSTTATFTTTMGLIYGSLTRPRISTVHRCPSQRRLRYHPFVSNRGSINLNSAQITGGAYFGTGSAVTSENSTLSQSLAADPALLVTDGSSFVSLGRNTISNSASGGTAISVTNTGAYPPKGLVDSLHTLPMTLLD